MLETRVTDALGRHAESYTDEKGRNRETVQHAANGDVRVSYGYDAVGQVLTVHHPNGKTTAYQYDLLGHKLRVNHPDAGEVTFTYDAAGNLLTKLTAELKKTISDKASITCTYDYERLSEVLYPKNLFNRVTYTYGKPGAKYNRAGRLVLVEDASGGEAYYYGNQGEVVKTVRSVMVSQADVRTYVHAATYDSHNRVRTLTYPDGEVVSYGYDAAGQVTSIRSTKQGKEETIVAQVGYDKDGHTIYTRMGNGTESTYAYDRQRERLQGMLLTANGDSIMQTQYKYDPVDNILGISNVITPKAPKKPKGFGGFGRTDGTGGPDADKEKKEKPLGGAFSHTYAYDELNRLIRAEGKAKGIGYVMDMSFGLMGEPLTKVQRTDSGSVAGSYALAYEYGDTDHPTAPSQIGHERYTYDANGNLTLVEDDSLNTERRMAWDEENRLMALSDNGKTSRYTYNAAGKRIVKSHGYLEGVYVNGAPQGLTFHETEDYTIYPAPILSVTRQRFTKHYFIGDRRVASKIGAGIFQNAYGHGANVVTAGQKDYQMRMMQIERQREDYYRKLGTPPGVPTMKGATAEPENTHEGYNTIIKELGDHSVPDGWIQRPKRNAVPGTPPGPPVQWDKAEDPDDVQPGYGYVPADTAHEDIFYYHTDHLGSTSYITDAKANVAQFDAYLPYGELLVDEHSSSEDMPYKFNGKELDQETGLYYYGARYMNPRTSLWYGVDPLAEKYVSTGCYVYCIDNPIRLIDPDGTHWVEDNKKRIVWNEGITNKEQAAAAGLIYRGKSYQRFFINNETYAVKREQYTQGRRLIISKAQKYRMDFSGKVVTAKQLTGRKLNTSRNAPYGIQGKADLNAVFSDGTTRTAATFEFNSGPYGNGPTPNNSYEAFGAVPTNESGMLSNGHTGWKVLLPNYNGRSGLRVHPDTNSPGTKGCIGIVGCYEELKNLGNFFNKYIGPSGKNRMIFNFNIKGNPNYGNEGKANSRLAQ